jgi:hypothetical protein
MTRAEHCFEFDSDIDRAGEWDRISECDIDESFLGSESFDKNR